MKFFVKFEWRWHFFFGLLFIKTWNEEGGKMDPVSGSFLLHFLLWAYFLSLNAFKAFLVIQLFFSISRISFFQASPWLLSAGSNIQLIALPTFISVSRYLILEYVALVHSWTLTYQTTWYNCAIHAFILKFI